MIIILVFFPKYAKTRKKHEKRRKKHEIFADYSCENLYMKSLSEVEFTKFREAYFSYSVLQFFGFECCISLVIIALIDTFHINFTTVDLIGQDML